MMRLGRYPDALLPVRTRAAWFYVVLMACGVGWDLPAVGRPNRLAADGDWLVKTWETRDGLPENSATAMVQTPDHYLWFGTFNGLVRFDGVRFTVLDTVNTPGLPSAGIVNLHLDASGRLWVSTLNGLVWREADGSWGAPPGELPGPAEFIRTFTQRGNGDLLLTTFEGGVLEHAEGRLRALPPPPGLTSVGYFGGVDEQGRWCVVQAGFVGVWTGQTWESLIPRSELPGDRSDRMACALARDGGLWILVKDHVRRYVGGREVTRRSVAGFRGGVWSMTEDSRGDLWICMMDVGALQVRTDGGARLWNEDNGLAHPAARFVFEDREHNLWIGTSGGGLTRLKVPRFFTFGRDQGLGDRAVKTVWPAPDGGMWVGTYGDGLLQLRESAVTPVPLPTRPAAARHIQSVITDRQGRVWVGTYVSGLFLRDGAGWRAIPREQTGGANVIALREDSRGRIWVSGGRQFAVHEDGVFRVFGEAEGLVGGGVRCFGEGADGTVWLSTFDRVFRVLGDRLVEARAPDGSSLREVTCFHAAAGDAMWMGSLNAGLLRWQPGALARVSLTNGLPVRGIFDILADGRGALWMASNRGVVRTELEKLSALAEGRAEWFEGQLLNEDDGMVSVESPNGQQPVAARDGQGRLWFATLKGVAMIDPAGFRENPVVPPAIIEELRYAVPAPGSQSGVAVEQRIPAPFAAPPEFPPRTHRVEVHYTAPGFSAPDKMRFRYRLRDGDQMWRDVGSRRVAYFEDLPPGRYRFEVQAANDDGRWSPETTVATFTVLPQYWQTMWFRGMVITAFLGLVAGFALRLLARREQRAAARTEFTRLLIASQEGERARLARELHDDITQRLARLAIDAGQVERTATGERERRVLGDVREGLARLSEDVHALSYRLHPSILEDLGLVEALRAEGERLMRHAPFSVQVKVSGVPDRVPKDSALCLFRVAEEALQNVVRHARARRVEIALRGLDRGLQLAVQDDGVGFDPSLNGRRPSLGLASMRQRVSLLGGHLDIESAPGEGTAIVVWLPMTATDT